jgi:galactonate dehydratase
MKTVNSRRAFLGKAACIAAVATASPLAGFGRGFEKAMEESTKSSIPSDLKITDVKCGYVRGSLFVKIYTNQDIWGCGEGVSLGTKHWEKAKRTKSVKCVQDF